MAQIALAMALFDPMLQFEYCSGLQERRGYRLDPL